MHRLLGSGSDEAGRKVKLGVWVGVACAEDRAHRPDALTRAEPARSRVFLAGMDGLKVT